LNLTYLTILQLSIMLSPARLRLCCRTLFWRWVINRWYLRDRRSSLPRPPKYTFKLSIPSTLSQTPGSITLYFYTPPSYTRPSGKSPNPAKSKNLYRVIVNFHGGGYTIGGPEDDARWAAHLTAQNAICISVDYRMAALYPYPTAVEDCASAILWVMQHGASYNLDAWRIVLSGFSAGGELCFTSQYLLHTKLKEQGLEVAPEGNIAGMVSFYPGLDYTKTRAERDASNPVAAEKSVIPAFLGEMYDRAYFYPRPADMAHPYISAGLAADSMLEEALPDRIWLHSCEWDNLLAEAEAFRQRLKKVGKEVSGGMVEGQVHAWDKVATYQKGNVLRDRVYGGAVAEIGRMWEASEADLGKSSKL
jgi:acetyl esterase/lipase